MNGAAPMIAPRPYGAFAQSRPRCRRLPADPRPPINAARLWSLVWRHEIGHGGRSSSPLHPSRSVKSAIDLLPQSDASRLSAHPCPDPTSVEASIPGMNRVPIKSASCEGTFGKRKSL